MCFPLDKNGCPKLFEMIILGHPFSFSMVYANPYVERLLRPPGGDSIKHAVSAAAIR